MGTHQPIRKIVTPEIPDKLYFRIGDVARICEVPAYVLRFWETEFPQLKPNKGGTGQRLYRKRDVEMALRIKSLLYDQGYTIPGARQVFKSEAKARETAPGASAEAENTAPRPPLARASAPEGESSGSDTPLRLARLQALRDEMKALLEVLSSPIRAGSLPAGDERPKLHALRPRLVPEGSATPAKGAVPRGFSRVHDPSRDRQADLFSSSPLKLEPAQPDRLLQGAAPLDSFEAE